MASRHKEFSALVQCLRGRVPDDLEWGEVLRLANRTLVSPSLADRLRCRQDVPQEVHGFLKEIESRAIHRNHLLRGQLEEALCSLNGTGLQPILLKGAALLATAAGETFSRIMSDLDLLLSARSVEPALRELEKLGYRYFAEGPNAWGVHAMGRLQDAGSLDLHLRIKVARPLLDYRRLSRRATEVNVGGARALIPSPEDQALIIILHDQVQEYDYARGSIDLRHLLDLDWLHRNHDVDWASLPGMAESRHGRNAVRVQLRTLQQLWGRDFPKSAVGYLWTWLQYRRRWLQLRIPEITPLATLMTLLFDPPINPQMREADADIEHVRRPLWRIRRLHELSWARALEIKA